jgi:hypothetical protein
MDISEFLEEKMNVVLIAPLILVCQNLTRFKKFK